MNHTSSSSPAGSDPISSQNPLLISSTLGDANANLVTISEGEMIPQPMECLQGTQIPPFLSKTFDLVDDPMLDPIISWGGGGLSFVVWDPIEFSRLILPRNFKHNNFSSFVRQLNTCKVIEGFHKIDTDKWEFANESFIRGLKNLLKNIQRRKSNQSHSTTNEEFHNMLIEAEIERLQKQKMEMMHQIIELKNKNCDTHRFMESVNEKLKAAEDKQKQLVSFLAKMFQNKTFLSSSSEENEQMLRLSSPTTSRKFVKHQPHEQTPLSVGGLSRNLEFGREPEYRESKGKNVLEIDSEAAPEYLSEPISGGIDDVTVKEEDIWSDIGSYELPEFGAGGGELSEFWNTDP